MEPRSRGAVTVRDVAARAGVGLSTVSNVLNRPHVVAPETLARVQAAIGELGYVRNDAARALRLGASRAVGIVVSEASSPFFAEVTRAASLALGRAGYSTLLGDAAQSASVEAQLLELFEQQRVRGLLIAPTASAPAGLSNIVGRGVPVIFMDATADDEQFCAVSVDEERGVELAIGHLARTGRSRIALVRGSEQLPQIVARTTAARAAALRHGVALEEILASGYFVQAGIEAAAVIAGRRADDRPDAVFAVNDLLAMGVVSGLIDHGVDVPGDIAVVGYDDVDVAAVARVPLTTIRQPAEQIGTRAAALLMTEMDAAGGPHRHEATRFMPELVVRSSSMR